MSEKSKALDSVLSQIERQFGKGSIMRLGDETNKLSIESIPTGSMVMMLRTGLTLLMSFLPVLKALRLAFLMSPIGIIVALAAAIAMLWDDYKTWKEGGKSLFGGLNGPRESTRSLIRLKTLLK